MQEINWQAEVERAKRLLAAATDKEAKDLLQNNLETSQAMAKWQAKKANLKQRTDQAKADLQKWTALAASPDLSPQASQAARQLARSSQATVILSEKALAWQDIQSPTAQPIPYLTLSPEAQSATNSANLQGSSSPANSAMPKLEDSFSKLSNEQVKAAWIKGQTLAALSLAQQELPFQESSSDQTMAGSAPQVGADIPPVGPAPSLPTLEQFGLSENAVADIPWTWFDIWGNSKINRNGFIIYLIFHSLAFMAIFHEKIGFNFASFIGFFAFGFPFVIPFMIFTSLVWQLEKKLRAATHTGSKNYLDYQHAYSVYLQKVQKHLVQIQERDLRIAKRQREFWRTLSGVKFEQELGKLFILMGYKVTYTPVTSDGGVDLCLVKDGSLTVVQCKAHNKRIPIGTARELCTSMTDFQANSAIIACFEGVTKPVVEYIRNKPVTVLDLDGILALQKQYG